MLLTLFDFVQIDVRFIISNKSFLFIVNELWLFCSLGEYYAQAFPHKVQSHTCALVWTKGFLWMLVCISVLTFIHTHTRICMHARTHTKPVSIGVTIMNTCGHCANTESWTNCIVNTPLLLLLVLSLLHNLQKKTTLVPSTPSWD